MISILRTNQISGILLVFLITIGAFVPFFINPTSLEIHGTYGIFDDLFYDLYEHPYWMLSITIVITYLTGFIFQNWLSYHKIIDRESYFPLFFTLFLIIALPQNIGFTPILLALFVLLFGLIELYKIYENRPILGPIFNASFLFSIAALIYNPLILLIPYIWIVYLTSGSVTGRGLIISFIGISIPFFYLFSYSFYTDSIQQTWDYIILHNLDFVNIPAQFTFSLDWIFILIMAIVVIFIAVYYFSQPSSYKILPRKYNISLASLFIWTLATMLFSGSHYLQHLQLSSISLSAGLAFYFATAKNKKRAEILFWFIILMGISLHIMFHFQS